MADEFRLVEASYDPTKPGDAATINAALAWSGLNKLPVYAFHDYLLGDPLIFPANATLIAAPTARFIRGFGGTSNGPGTAFPLVTTDGDQPNIRIQGGLWGGIAGVDVEPKKATITFAAGSAGPPATPNTISFTGVRNRYFSNGVPRTDVLPQIWVYKKDADGNYDPAVPNNNRIFTVVNNPNLGPNTIEVSETPETSPTPTVVDMYASHVPRAGNGFAITSTGGVIDGVGLLTPRGIQFQLEGDGFLLTRSWSRNPTPDGGGGVRFAAGVGMRGSLLDLESIDDCYQFNPGDNSHATVARSSYVDCIGRTYQGALIAFINGNGRAYLPDKPGENNDSLTSLRDCLAANVRGVTGGSALHGGVAVKMYCANSSKPMVNCWVEDVSVRQSAVTPPDTLQAGIMIVTGRPGGGVVNSGARNLVVENRSGPLVAIGPADSAPANFSTAVDFTVEQARGPGAGTQPGLPLIAAPYADRLVLRDVSGDLAGTGRALEIGTTLNYVAGGIPQTILAGLVGELVVDGCSTAGAALPATDSGKRQGIWQFGNVAKASVRRLSTTLAAGATVGGIELVKSGVQPGPTFCRFAEIDFANIANIYEIAVWQTQVGNRIVDSLRFDDQIETLTIGNTAVVSPARFAPTIQLAFDSGVTSTALTGMTVPGVPAPRCTLLVPSNMTLSTPASPVAGSFLLTSTLTGGATRSITLQWIAASNRWREVARTT